MKIRIGTRASLLAVAQAELLKQHIERNHPSMEVELVKITTTGDKILDRKLDEIGGKGLFVKELDIALRERRTDLTVHSLKDMPMEEDGEYPILGFSHREDAADVLVLQEGCKELDISKPIGTASPRRSLQLTGLYPGCKVESVRGNIQTRLGKLDSGEYGALVLAAAGLKRLGYGHRISRRFLVNEIVPAAGQGILAVQGRKDFDRGMLAGFFDEDARLQALAERSFVRSLNGGCSSPVAAYAKIKGAQMSLTGFAGVTETGRLIIGTCTAPKKDAVSLGVQLAGILCPQA